MGRLDSKVALVTGGASGIGAATVRRFVAEGASVVVADVQDERGEAFAAEIGTAAHFIRTDVTEERSIAAAVDGTVARFGRLDVVFNNAGIIGAVGPIAALRVEDYELTLAVNLRGVILGMKHAARVMEPQGSGVVLSTTSPAAVAGGLGPHAYSAAKAAVIGLTQSVAAELRPKGIRVNAIMPGAMVTAMTASLKSGDPDALEETHATMARDALMARPGLPDDVAAAAAYLASDDGAYVTGIVLRVDAGLTNAPGSSPFASGPLAEHEFVRENGRVGR